MLSTAAYPFSWTDLNSVLVGTPLTLGAYWIALKLQRALRRSALANPVLLAILLIALVLRLTHTTYQDYFSGARLIHLCLGPVTVGLAFPLAASLRKMKDRLLSAIPAITAGSFVSAASGLLLVHLCHGTRLVAHSMAPKAATTPIAIGVAQGIGGEPALTATFAILSGILVATTVDRLLARIHTHDWPAFGLAAGTAGSGIATARAFQINELAGGFAGLALGLNGFATALLVPLLVQAEGLFR